MNMIVRVALRKFGLQTYYENDETLNLKPVIIVMEEHRIVILDIACPYDLYLSETYEFKLEKYNNLQQLIAKKIMSCTVDAVIIGSLGTVNKNALNILMDIGMRKIKAKELIKWCSTFNIIGSRQIWNISCKLVNSDRREINR